ncbi:HAD-IC family P-type ATPase [Burkholderia oklahomensis]|uniref:HAD ATPase, P-type, IC family protein n=3 Tax=Burkholderia oklahomensis TaxID=342113 RepID=A0AAI8BF38_9BURK|nr:HAD-IC family P-type ATPase [Burkholderia oklahomensis]AIO70824.1 HAD ATPase, P-type, IC family protein [Burkholderia oklahomensis]AOI39315.1 divalent cation transporter [Burkholderia oklahomensis EO147]KUY47876.1 divalent cation transporter [Burkholderia oklahomensis EO147]QPS40331.1 HAD-IC family P-type ATPase [Burkholderia oklahomensis]
MIADDPPGLTSTQAAQRLAQFGANEVAEPRVPLSRRIVAHFWAPIPWMLEAAIVLQLIIGERLEATIIGALLIFNVALSLFQEARAAGVLDVLKARLAPAASVRRDGRWTRVPAASIVPGDAVKLTLGAIVPADVRIISGAVLLDQSTLTGESAPVEAAARAPAYAGGLVRQGAAVAEVTATGARTYFGRTAELVRIAGSDSSEQRAIVAAVRNLAAVNAAIVVALVLYAHAADMPLPRILPLVLTAILASIPVALPATFTLAAALGAQRLARGGVLLTRLSALHEAAAVDVLCVDKTGTLTANAVRVDAVRAASPNASEDDVLAYAALTSAEGSADAVDAAIRRASAERPSPALAGARVVRFTPFDPGRRIADACVDVGDGRTLRVLKGAPAAVAAAAGAQVDTASVDALAQSGLRVLAVAAGRDGGPVEIVGYVGLGDPPRADSAPLVAQLRTMGVRPVMVTGDTAATARVVARAVGLGAGVATPANVNRSRRPPNDVDVYAEVLPEDKFHLVKAFQDDGHVVAMCGDGVNDAPALRQAQAGVAVSTATDVAKKAAAIVLTKPGLDGIVAAIVEGRCAFERLTTYALNALAKKIHLVLFLAAGVLMTGHALLTPMLMALLLITGDFITMALTTDRVTPSASPDAWRMRRITLAAAAIGLCQCAFGSAVMAVAHFRYALPVDALRSLAFVTLVFDSQAVVYVIRDRRRLQRARPWSLLFASSLVDVALAVVLTTSGTLMAPLAPRIIAAVLVATIGFAIALELLKGVALGWLDRAASHASHASGAPGGRTRPGAHRPS